ncbi:aminoglycoside adenylyltransferase domain-containing protein [Heyndrickxia sporothermodurans]|uniref:aminoglycoside adenylyltransferase domain-containing protein n=1 Tax=Heyndrickxia sporothermodurans TaxID=46224 RepID=UPI002E1F98D4|nr:DUF4111 domain-containing protein [Heyndrickxia sporothermodurans]MED3697749.1 DUF4111 domain-containing protein [Heyndrickxia sporothermodurans]
MNHIPVRVNEVLSVYFDFFESKLPNLLDSYYLYGSTSLGEYNERQSDIDFIAVVKREMSETEIHRLKDIHYHMQKRFPHTTLDGVYILQIDLESPNKNTPLCPYFNDGKFKGFKKFDQNSIDAYQLKKYGVTVRGEKIENVNFDVNWDVLIENMRANLNTYWRNWTNDCKKFLSLKYIGLFFNLGMIEWGVLGVSRIFYTFREKDITSKVGAGEYALRAVPQKWHKIINESMRFRKGNKKSFYTSVFERRKDALAYMEFIIRESNRLFTEDNRLRK